MLPALRLQIDDSRRWLTQPGNTPRGHLWAAVSRCCDDAYGFFGVLYSASFWNGFQMVS